MSLRMRMQTGCMCVIKGVVLEHLPGTTAYESGVTGSFFPFLFDFSSKAVSILRYFYGITRPVASVRPNFRPS